MKEHVEVYTKEKCSCGMNYLLTIAGWRCPKCLTAPGYCGKEKAKG
jgi:hypothetical protein